MNLQVTVFMPEKTGERLPRAELFVEKIGFPDLSLCVKPLSLWLLFSVVFVLAQQRYRSRVAKYIVLY
jgi:hypothetical protein